MSDLIERLKGPFKYHDNMLCVPESLIEDCGRALSSPLPDDVEMACLNLRTRIGAPEYADMLERLARVAEKAKIQGAAYEDLQSLVERLTQDNANLVSINAAHRVKRDELEVKIERLTRENATLKLKLKVGPESYEKQIEELEKSRDAFEQMYLKAAYDTTGDKE